MADVNITTSLRGANQVTSGFSRMAASISGVVRSFAPLTALASGGGILLLANNAIQTADRFDKLSDRLGVSVKALSELEFAAEQSGIQFSQMTMALQRMSRRMGEAAIGTGEAKDAIKELGLNATEMVKLSPEEMLERVAEALGNVTGSSEKLRLAFKLFDSEGVSMLQMIGNGAEDMKELRAQAEQLGRSISDEAAASAVEFKDALNAATSSMSGPLRQAILDILPHLTELVVGFTTWNAQSGAGIGIAQVLVTVFKVVAATISILSATVQNLGVNFARVFDFIWEFMTGDWEQAIAKWKAGTETIEDINTNLADTFETLWPSDSMKQVSKEMKDFVDDYKKTLRDLTDKPDKGGDKENPLLKGLKTELDSLIKEHWELKGLGDQWFNWHGPGSDPQTKSPVAGPAADALRKQIAEQRSLNEALRAEQEEAKRRQEEWDEIWENERRLEKEAQDAEIEAREARAARIEELQRSLQPQIDYNAAIKENKELLAAGALTDRQRLILDQQAAAVLRERIAAGEMHTEQERAAIKEGQALNELMWETAEAIKRAQDPMYEFTETISLYEKLLDATLITQDEFNQAVIDLEKEWDRRLGDMKTELTDWQKAMINAVNGFGREFTNTLDRILDEGAQSFADFRDAIFSLFRREIIHAFITEPLVEAIQAVIGAMKGGTGKSGLFGFLGSTIGGSIFGSAAPVPAGGFGTYAAGGKFPANQPMLVGEEGPELLLPGSSGTIVPNHALGGGGTIVINQTFTAGVTHKELASILPALRKSTIAGVLEAKRRGGSYARGLA